MDSAEVYILEFSKDDSMKIAAEVGARPNRGQAGYFYPGHSTNAADREEQHLLGYHSNHFVQRFRPVRRPEYTDHLPALNRAEATYIEGIVGKRLHIEGFGVLGDSINSTGSQALPLDVRIIGRFGPCMGDSSRYFSVSDDRICGFGYPNIARKVELIRGVGRARFDCSGLNLPGGRFSINEHKQLIIRTSAPKGSSGHGTVYFVAYEDGEPVMGALEDSGFIPPAGMQIGAEWEGRREGSYYRFVPGEYSKGNVPELSCGVSGRQIDSKYLQNQSDLLDGLMRFLPKGGYLKVNHHCFAFTYPLDSVSPMLFMGQIDIAKWLPLRRGASEFTLPEIQRVRLDALAEGVVSKVIEARGLLRKLG